MHPWAGMATAAQEIRGPDRTGSARSLEALLEEVYGAARAERPGGPLPLRDWLEIAEAWRIVLALREARGNRTGAARALGIGRRTLYSKMKKLAIDAEWSL